MTQSQIPTPAAAEAAEEVIDDGSVEIARRRANEAQRAERKLGLLLVAPAVIIMLAVAAYPMAPVMLQELKNAVPRPRSPVYQNISTIVSTTLSPPAGINPQASANELRTSINDAIEGKGIMP